MHVAPVAHNSLCEAAAPAVMGEATMVNMVADAVVAASVDIATFVVTMKSAAGHMTF